MADPIKQTLTIVKTEEFRYPKANPTKTGYTFVAEDGTQFKAFPNQKTGKSELWEKFGEVPAPPREYWVQPEEGKDAKLVGIVGVYEPKWVTNPDSGGGYGGGKRGLSPEAQKGIHASVALQHAVALVVGTPNAGTLPPDVLQAADLFYDWLRSKSGDRSGSSSGETQGRTTSNIEGTAPEPVQVSPSSSQPSPEVPGNGGGARAGTPAPSLLEQAAKAYGNKAAVLKAARAHYGTTITSVDDITDEQYAELLVEIGAGV